MQSETRFFHKGISRNLLLRCWPLWTGWFALLMLTFPLAVNNRIHSWRGEPDVLRSQMFSYVLESGCTAAKLAIPAAIITVMAMYSYLYNARTCGMINALPIRRKTVFLTAYFTGLLPLLAAELLTALAAWGMLHAWVPASLIGKWISLAAMGTVAFYGFSVFCAMLTGSLYILPLVYTVLNLTAFVVEQALRQLLRIFLFGYTEGSGSLHWLSPIIQVLARLNAILLDPEDAANAVSNGAGGLLKQSVYVLDRNSIVLVNGENILVGYCAAGILLSALSLLLYRRRRMETAGDTVAIPVLKPVFKYCMAFGTALVLSAFVTGEFFGDSFRTSGRALVAVVLLMAGAFIGYFAAEMLMQKTMRVFHTKWKGLLVVWSVLALFVIACEFDITGYEARIPKGAEVEQVSFGPDVPYSSMKEAENVDAMRKLHESILQNRENDANPSEKISFNIRYTLKNGKELNRSYFLNRDEVHRSDHDSDLWLAQGITNIPEAILSRQQTKIEILPETIQFCRVYTRSWPAGAKGIYEETKELVLSPQEAYDLYTEAILPDMEEGLIGRQYFFDEAAHPTRSDTGISIDLAEGKQFRPNGTFYFEKSSYCYFEVETDSVRTIAWLKEHTGLEVQPFDDLASSLDY